jgi:hypothetical protein
VDLQKKRVFQEYFEEVVGVVVLKEVFQERHIFQRV